MESRSCNIVLYSRSVYIRIHRACLQSITCEATSEFGAKNTVKPTHHQSPALSISTEEALQDLLSAGEGLDDSSTTHTLALEDDSDCSITPNAVQLPGCSRNGLAIGDTSRDDHSKGVVAVRVPSPANGNPPELIAYYNVRIHTLHYPVPGLFCSVALRALIFSRSFRISCIRVRYGKRLNERRPLVDEPSRTV